MGWCHDCVDISSSLQHKELALAIPTMALFVILLLFCHGKQGKGLGCNTEQNNTAADVSFQVYHKELLLIPAQQMNAIKRKLLNCYLLSWSYRAARLLAELQSKPEEGTWEKFCYIVFPLCCNRINTLA